MAFRPNKAKARPVTAPPSQTGRRVGLTQEDYSIQAVTIVAEGEEGNPRNQFSALLEIDLASGRLGSRRKEGVRSIAMPVEVKDISVIAQLSGRPISISHWVDESIQERDQLVSQLCEKEQELNSLKARLDQAKQQIHFLVEGSRS